MTNKCTLYRCSPYTQFLSGYVVYRNNFDVKQPFLPSTEWLYNNKVAVFVTENEAKHYCKYRNELTEQNGTDAVDGDA